MLSDVTGNVAGLALGNGPDHFPADHIEDGLQKAQNVRNSSRDGAHAARAHGTYRH